MYAQALHEGSAHGVEAFSTSLLLEDGEVTSVHVVRYDLEYFQPRLQVFGEATPLARWCGERAIGEAVVGGFFSRLYKLPLGELWIDGVRHENVSFHAPWHAERASLYISPDAEVRIGKRHEFDALPEGSLLQAGPLLVRNGRQVYFDGADAEGFSAASDQFDTDITDGRYPRSAIGCNRDSIWTVVCDGSSDERKGLTFGELAAFMLRVGAVDAMNLDGGGSATQVSGGVLRNHPYGDGRSYPEGRPVHTAIIFEPASYAGALVAVNA